MVLLERNGEERTEKSLAKNDSGYAVWFLFGKFSLSSSTSDKPFSSLLGSLRFLPVFAQTRLHLSIYYFVL